MNRYQLAKLVEWAGTIKTRKQLQKVVYLLQASGCPFEAEYTLHLYGPYSADVAQRTDEMVGAGFLDENPTSVGARGQSFSYQLTDKARQKLREVDGQENTRPWLEQMSKFKSQAEALFQEPELRKLEFASTIAYFREEQKMSWEKARDAAAKFKKQKPNGQAMREAFVLAKGILEAEASA